MSTHGDHIQKRHALRRDVQLSQPLWVGNDADWALMHGPSKLPTGTLICAEEGCRRPLVAVFLKATATRFLRNHPDGPACGHGFDEPSGGGGLMSDEHRWLQQRVKMLCEDLGHPSLLEHYASRSDVWVENVTPGPGVPGKPLAIEVQRWSTRFAERTQRRQDLGATVLWMFPESAKSGAATQALFEFPSVRIRVMRADNRRVSVTPWKADHSGRVRLCVGGTVMRFDASKRAMVSAGNYDAKAFIQEVLSGERDWYPRGTVGFPTAGWARVEDVTRMRAHGVVDKASVAFVGECTTSEPRETAPQTFAPVDVPSPQPIVVMRPELKSVAADPRVLVEPGPAASAVSNGIRPAPRSPQVVHPRPGMMARLQAWLARR